MRSDKIKRGLERAGNRALLYATGISQSELVKPFIGVCTSFTDLIPGNYFVRFIAPGDYVFSPPNKGDNDAIDSDVRPGNDGTTPTTNLGSGEHDPSLDAGLYRPASLGDYVWYDVNADGLQDAAQDPVRAP